MKRLGWRLLQLYAPDANRELVPKINSVLLAAWFLEVKTAFKLEQERAKADQIMDMLLKDEEVRSFLARKIYELYASSQHPPTS